MGRAKPEFESSLVGLGGLELSPELVRVPLGPPKGTRNYGQHQQQGSLRRELVVAQASRASRPQPRRSQCLVLALAGCRTAWRCGLTTGDPKGAAESTTRAKVALEVVSGCETTTNPGGQPFRGPAHSAARLEGSADRAGLLLLRLSDRGEGSQGLRRVRLWCPCSASRSVRPKVELDFLETGSGHQVASNSACLWEGGTSRYRYCRSWP